MSTTSTSAPSTPINNIKNLAYNILKTLKDGIVKGKKISELGPCSECDNDILISPLKAFTYLTCGHLFHRLCIEKKLLLTVPNTCPFPGCGKNVEILDQADVLGTISNLPLSDPKEGVQSSGISPLMGETFALSSPPIRMEGIEGSATQQGKSNLRCAKCSEDLSSYLPPIGFLRFSPQPQGPSKPLVYLTCKHIVHYNCIDNPRKLCPICPSTDMEIDDDVIVTGTQESSTAQKKHSREDSNESSTSTSGKKAKKTKKPVDRDQSPTLQRLIKELTTTDPGNEEILQTDSTSESNNDSNIFLNLYKKIVAGEDQLKRQRKISLNHEDLASQSLVDDDVQKQLPKDISEEALRKRIERAQKVYGLFSSINADANIEEKITAGSVIYQAIEDNPWIEKNELRDIIEEAVSFVNKAYLEILPEFEISYKTVCSLRDIGAVKISKEMPLDSDQIVDNIKKLKGKLKQNKKSSLCQELFSSLRNVDISALTWKDFLANQIISDDSILLQQLTPQSQEDFMELKRKMTPPPLPPKIRRKCSEFVVAFNENHQVELTQRIKHDGTWKESEKQLAKVTDRILDTLRDTWNNPAFSPEFAGFLSEGTYVNNIILPAIRAVLKGLPLEKSTFVSSSELQSSASADRKGEGRSGRRPDIMFITMRDEKNYELLYTECSRLTCTAQKERHDADEFGIVGVQIAGTTIRLNVLIRDSADVHRYYHLREAKIQIRQSNPIIVANFIEVLLILRNILIVNMDLLYNALIPRTPRKVEDSSTVSSPRREGEQKRTRKINVQPTPSKLRSSISILPKDPEEKQKHVIKIVLERFPYLTLKHSFKY
ncbi:24559_t:CDS:2, partial [Gigaspora margarita]